MVTMLTSLQIVFSAIMGVISSDINAYVMGAFLPLSMINVWENSYTFYTRRTKLDAVQWVSSISQILNLIVVSFLTSLVSEGRAFDSSVGV
jgi:hypothetical protein